MLLPYTFLLPLVNSQVGAPARVGLVAPIDVIVPPGNTGLDPSQTSFFQVLFQLQETHVIFSLLVLTL